MATLSCSSVDQADVASRIIAMERSALDRWGKGDVQGYLGLYAADITYFDPAVERRVDGIEAVRKYIGPFAGRIGIRRYEMIDPKVQQYGDVAVLSYQLVDEVNKTPEGPANLTVRWNCTQIYARRKGQWRIVHNHWAYTKGEMKR